MSLSGGGLEPPPAAGPAAWEVGGAKYPCGMGGVVTGDKNLGRGATPPFPAEFVPCALGNPIALVHKNRKSVEKYVVPRGLPIFFFPQHLFVVGLLFSQP